MSGCKSCNKNNLIQQNQPYTQKYSIPISLSSSQLTKSIIVSSKPIYKFLILLLIN